MPVSSSSKYPVRRKVSVSVNVLHLPAFSAIIISSSLRSTFPCFDTTKDRAAANAARLSIRHPDILASLGVSVPLSRTKYRNLSDSSSSGEYSPIPPASTFFTCKSSSFKSSSVDPIPSRRIYQSLLSTPKLWHPALGHV